MKIDLLCISKYFNLVSSTPLSKLLINKTNGMRMLVGAVIGLGVISLLVFSVPDPDPAWGSGWRIRPLVITPLAAAFGGLAFILRDLVRPQTGAMRLTVFVLSTLCFLVALWLGTVLGLDGTLWN